MESKPINGRGILEYPLQTHVSKLWLVTRMIDRYRISRKKAQLIIKETSVPRSLVKQP